MDTAGYYRQGTSVTHSLAESPFQTPPNTYPGHLQLPIPSTGNVSRLTIQTFLLLTKSWTGFWLLCWNKRRRVGTVGSGIIMIMKLSFPPVAKQEKEIASMKEQLNTVVCEIEQIKDVSSSASESKITRQPIPREISVSLYAPLSVCCYIHVYLLSLPS